MTVDEALERAVVLKEQHSDDELWRGEREAVVLAAEVIRLREQVAHLERLALRSRSAGAGR